MIVNLQSKENPIATLFDKARPLNEDKTDMSYEAFKKCLTDPQDEHYMDMDRLMKAVYPVTWDDVENVKAIWALYERVVLVDEKHGGWRLEVVRNAVDEVDGDHWSC